MPRADLTAATSLMLIEPDESEVTTDWVRPLKDRDAAMITFADVQTARPSVVRLFWLNLLKQAGRQVRRGLDWSCRSTEVLRLQSDEGTAELY